MGPKGFQTQEAVLKTPEAVGGGAGLRLAGGLLDSAAVVWASVLPREPFSGRWPWAEWTEVEVSVCFGAIGGGGRASQRTLPWV